jgi:sugar fermentation stimulation protein A
MQRASLAVLSRGAGLINQIQMPKRSGNSSAAALQAAKKICIQAVEDTTNLCLFKYEQLVAASLDSRYKRFLGDVRLANDGEAETTTTTIHVPNTGPMTGLLDALPASVLLSKSSNLTRKYAHTLEWIHADGAWVGTHSAKANAFVKVLLQANAIPELLPYTEIKPEIKYGSENSRVDFCLERGDGGKQILAEVKSVTLAEDTEMGTKIALFPDTVSIRAQRHVSELTKVVQKGGEAAMIFLIQRGDCAAFAPCWAKDPVYSNLVVEAVQAGVKVVALVCDLDPAKGEVIFKGTVPINLEYRGNL